MKEWLGGSLVLSQGKLTTARFGEKHLLLTNHIKTVPTDQSTPCCRVKQERCKAGNCLEGHKE